MHHCYETLLDFFLKAVGVPEIEFLQSQDLLSITVRFRVNVQSGTLVELMFKWGRLWN